MSELSVQSNLKKGQVLDSGFVILDVVELKELKALGIWAKHEKSKAEVFHVLNDDIENLFSFAFATFPGDSTGVAHILEHSVLCGSERYPLKDAFIVLVQGSLQTFLNAMTFPDKTVYPASSTNEHDYFNLMSVYGSAVFEPLLPQWTFLQEGHRLEFTKEGKLSITGIVYNEMKGAYSSLETYAGHWSVKSIMPGTPYDFESGGNPQDIPNLTWEGLKEFHKSRYNPANCRIFLAGNIPTEKQLSFLNEQFFSVLDSGNVCEPIKKAERWKEPRDFHVPCPAGSELKSTIFLSWLCSDITDINENIALAALTEILLGHDGSPLTRTLIESGLGEDITPVSGLEGEIRETLFVAGLKGVSGDAQQMGRKVEKLIMELLQKLVSEGIPEEEIEAALLAMEFSQREVRRSGGPFSLTWMRRSLRSWLHGSKPWEGLLFEPAIANVKKNLASDKKYFESLIKKYFLDNPHRALVILEPKEDFLPKQEEKLAVHLSDMEKELNNDERQSIVENSEMLEKIQNETDSPQALAAIPHLSRNDLSAEIDLIDRRYEKFDGGVLALSHELYTNGITYTDIAFPVDLLSFDDYSWLPFFSRAVVSVGLPGMDYAEVSSLLARTAGGLITMLHTGSAVKNVTRNPQTDLGNFNLAGRDWIIFRLKCLDEKLAPSLDLLLRFINEADFSSHRRIKDLVLEMKNEINANLAPMGHIYASGRASRLNSFSKRVEEIWGGVSQIEFVNRLADLAENDIAAVAHKLEYLREKIAGFGLIANITGGSLKNAGSQFAQRFSGFGPPLDRNLISGLPEDGKLHAAEVFASQSLQVGFAALTFKAAPFDTIEQIAESVLTHQLSTGALWENIRMKGGSYGAFASTDSIEDCLSFATYRDPNPLNSLDVISSILKDSSHGECSEDHLVKSIIGCYAKETRPKTGAENGLIDFYRFLYGLEDSYRKRRLERLVSVSTADIAAVFASLGARSSSGTVIIAGAKTAEQAAKALGTDVQMLPV